MSASKERVFPADLGLTPEVMKERVHDLFEAIRFAFFEHEMKQRIEAHRKAQAAAEKSAAPAKAGGKRKSKKTVSVQ